MAKQKGEITTQQLVFIIILIISFGILLFFILRLNLGETTKKEICHNSVVLFDKSKISGKLDCNTNYICISKKDECNNFDSDKVVSAKTKEEIMDIFAKEMADCWWMFGEGEVRYASGISGYHCAICSVIKIDESLKDEAEKISSTDFNSYLASKIREDKTYFVFLFGTTDSSNFENERYLFDKIDISKKYAVLTGINPNYIGDHEFIYPSIISVDEVSSSTKCTDFDITKN